MFKIIMTNFSLEKLFWIFKKRLFWILLIGMIGAGAAGVYAYKNQSSSYLAQVSFYVYSNPDYITSNNVNQSSNDIAQAKSLVSSYLEILRSKTFIQKIQEDTGLPYSVQALRSSIWATTVQNTALFNVYVICPMQA